MSLYPPATCGDGSRQSNLRPFFFVSDALHKASLRLHALPQTSIKSCVQIYHHINRKPAVLLCNLLILLPVSPQVEITSLSLLLKIDAMAYVESTGYGRRDGFDDELREDGPAMVEEQPVGDRGFMRGSALIRQSGLQCSPCMCMRMRWRPGRYAIEEVAMADVQLDRPPPSLPQ